TPTYTKPMLNEAGRAPRELNRLDIKNRTPLPARLEERLLDALDQLWPRVDALLVLDQVSEANCGVVTERVRARLTQLGEATPGKLSLADSRERIGLFRCVSLKPNERECRKAVGGGDALRAATEMARRTGRTVYCTRGEKGILVAQPDGATPPVLVPAY